MYEAQRTQGIDSVSRVISTAEIKTRWRHLHCLQNWPTGGATCISSQFDQQVGLLASVANLVISYKFGHQVAQLALVKFANQVGPFALPHCLVLPYWHYQLVLSWYPHLLESHQLSLTNVCLFVCLWRTSRPKDRTPGLPGSDKNTIPDGGCTATN